MEGVNISGQNLQTSDQLLVSKLSKRLTSRVSLGAEFNSLYPQSTFPIKIQSRLHHLNVLMHEILKFKLQTLQFTEMVLWCQENLQSNADFFKNFSMCKVPFFENLNDKTILKKNHLFFSRLQESVQRKCQELRNIYQSNPNFFYDLLNNIVRGLLQTNMKGDQNVIVEKNGSDFGKSLEFERFLKTLCSQTSKDELSTKEYLLISYIFKINIAIYSKQGEDIYLNNILLNSNDKDIDLCIFQQQFGNQVTIQICGKTEIQQLQTRLKMSLDLYVLFIENQTQESYLKAGLPEVNSKQEKNQQNLNSQYDTRTTKIPLKQVPQTPTQTPLKQDTRTPAQIPLKPLSQAQGVPVWQKTNNQQKQNVFAPPVAGNTLFQTMALDDGNNQQQFQTMEVVREEEEYQQSRIQAYVESPQALARMTLMKQPIVNRVDREVCSVCGEPIGNGRRLQNCDHLACFDCLQEYVQGLFKNGMRHLDKFTCYEQENGKTCGKKIQEPLLKILLTAPQYHEVCMNSSDIGNRYCPYETCNLRMDVDLRATGLPGKKQKYDCPGCKQPICKICFKKYHGENQKNQPCPTVIDELRQGIGNEAVAVCPVCEIFFLKDDHCDRVECDKCKLQLCFACSGPRYPTMVHGNHYHREGCPSYAEYTVKEGLHPKCELCQKNGKVCERPISLAEYKKKYPQWFKK